ncbi:hypothetical protein [Streptomyces sp. BE133]|uniref:hypothetical protein n=1 Tax=Streptomyces sp. BE133 TaxID=3002523 RepID=UPI002E78EC04|nr:hypothetical protein [Streptomyces sp. BE133]MEE1811070.1 hypothetical protein [Streptomyces sp. BE133]
MSTARKSGTGKPITRASAANSAVFLTAVHSSGSREEHAALHSATVDGTAPPSPRLPEARLVP